MVCSLCSACDHNKRTCTFKLKAPIGIDLSLVSSEPTSPAKQTRKCSLCGKCGHNSRTCTFQLEAPIDTVLSPVPHYDDTSSDASITEVTEAITSPAKQTRKCSLCGTCGHNSRTCGVKQSIACQELALTFDAAIANFKPMKRKITCSICSENGHNSRTCLLKCAPCSDQVVRSYCFASMSAEKAVSMARIIECSSIYDEE